LVTEYQMRALVRAGMKYHHLVLYGTSIIPDSSGNNIIALEFGMVSNTVDSYKKIILVLPSGRLEENNEHS
jgi:hypothetical protein